MKKLPLQRSAGFSLIELLVSVCVITCLCALITPKAWALLQKKNQLKTLNDCKAISSSLMEYAILAHGGASAVSPIDVADYALQKYDDVESLLAPAFLAAVPENDAWNRPFEVYWFGNAFTDVSGPQLYVVRSSGRDGLFDGGPYEIGSFPFQPDPSQLIMGGDDIVCADGALIRWPGAMATVLAGGP